MALLSTTGDDIENVISLFLSELNASDTSAAATPTHKVSHLLTLAQGFFVLDVVRCSRGACAPSTVCGVCTERDLYYRNPVLFGHQRSAHASVERVCGWLDVSRTWAILHHRQVSVEVALVRRFLFSPRRVCVRLQQLLAVHHADTAPAAHTAYTRESLGISAAGKAILAGAVEMELCSPCEVLDVSCCGAHGVSLTHSLVTRLVACRHPSSALATTSASALVVIEKECIFHALLQAVGQQSGPLRRSYVFLCTKGYPCVAARQWLRRVHATWPSLELHLLVDGDPHGLCIGLTIVGLLGAHARSAAVPAAAPLPFHLIGACPSRVFDRGTATTTTTAALPLATLPASAGIPLCDDDHRVLRRVTRTLQDVLCRLPAHSRSAPSVTVTTLRATLEKMLHEAEWMERSKVKCELQLACRAAGSPLCFLEAHIS